MKKCGCGAEVKREGRGCRRAFVCQGCRRVLKFVYRSREQAAADTDRRNRRKAAKGRPGAFGGAKWRHRPAKPAARHYIGRFAGINLAADGTLDRSVMLLVQNGRVVGRIENLGVR